MNKTAIKNFAIWARNKLIADIVYKAGLLGITENEIKNPLPQSTQSVQFFDIGTKDPYSISGFEIEQRKKLVEEIERKAKQSDLKTAFKSVVEEVAYTWFNRLIAIRFMEVNDYLPTRIRVLSSERNNKAEPDLVTHPMDANLNYTPYEKDRIMQLKQSNKLDELFRLLFIKQCNALNAILPELFEKTNDFTELMLNVSFTDKDGVVYHLVNDIPEGDFNVSKAGQVEIIGWMYQYYNTEPKNETFALLKNNVKITKERIPAATQLFTPDWIVRYMVENSLGRLWLEGHPNDELKSKWKYYLDEAEQEADVQKQLNEIREEYKKIKLEDIRFIDPCMGSGHILVYAFDVLMQIYESCGYSQRDAAKSIIENNLYGLDIDNRAYQLAYFAVMMKARQYNRQILNGKTNCHVYAIQESNSINRSQLNYFGADMNEMEKNAVMVQIICLLDTFIDAKEYGSILNVDNYNWQLLYQFVENVEMSGQMTMDTLGIDNAKEQMKTLVEIGEVMARKYDVVVTNPPYMGNNGMNDKLIDFVKLKYPESRLDMYLVFTELCARLGKKNSFFAVIIPHAFMFLNNSQKVREKLIKGHYFLNMLHLGFGTFGADFGTTTFVMRKNTLPQYFAKYFKLGDVTSSDEKKDLFLESKRINWNWYIQKISTFEDIECSPLVYWLSDTMIDIFTNEKKLSTIGATKQGLATSDNNRFLRYWHEVEYTKIGFDIQDIHDNKKYLSKWFPCNKGGAYRKWYGNNEYLINWENDGQEIKDYAAKLYKNYTRTIKNIPLYFLEGLTWSSLTMSKLSVRYSPKGSIFETKGSMCFPIDPEDVNYILGFMNSSIVNALLMVVSPTIDYHEGPLGRLPIKVGKRDDVNMIVAQNIKISKAEWDSFETSWNFIKHPLLRGSHTIEEAFEHWQSFTLQQFNQLKANEIELNRIFIDIYSLQEELTPAVEDKDVTIRKADLGRDIRSFISYAVGCMFGRYSLDVDGLIYAGGEWDDSKYSTFIPDKDNILPITDEEYFKDDVVGLFCAFLKKTFGTDKLDENLDFIAKALSNKGNSSREIIRNYFLKDFFKDHCKIYQKRPIYWLFDSGKADGFKALVYMHRYNKDTIGNLRIDYLHRIQRIYESEISTTQETIENSKDVREVTYATKRKEKLLKQLKETKEYDEKIAHLALARIAIDLDDGVKINYEKVQTDTDGKKHYVLAKI